MSLQKENLVSVPAITLPGDQFAHSGAPTEWWWHVGTLESKDGRKYGFEINATGKSEYAFTQIEITDVQKQCNYQKVNPIYPMPTNWAQYDQTKPWFVNLLGPTSDPKDGAISMQAIDNNPMNMLVDASFVDATNQKTCQLNLVLRQEGPPLLVWGTGCQENVNPKGKSPITRNNYYYSLTHLHASGSITIGTEKIEVTGITWMDHEYGAFPDGSTGKVIWLLQDIQLSNGLHLSNYTEFGIAPIVNKPMPSNATLLLQNGESIFIPTITTPMEPVYISSKGITYFLKFKIEIKEGNTNTSFLVDSLYPDQVFNDGEGADVYEGVAKSEMSIAVHLSQKIKKRIVVSTGTAWIEQNLG